KEAAAAEATGTVEVAGGKQAGFAPIPMLAWEVDRAGDVVAVKGGDFGQLPIKHLGGHEPTRIRARIAAGPSVKPLSEAMAGARRWDRVYTDRGGIVRELQGVLIERMAASSAPRDEIELGFVAEQSRTRRVSSGGQSER